MRDWLRRQMVADCPCYCAGSILRDMGDEMTRDEILDMPAGHDMDLLVAEKVLKLDSVGWNERFFHNRAKFSTDIRAAFEVAERVNKMIFNEELSLDSDYNYLTLDCVGYTSGYAASFDCLLDYRWFEDITNYKFAARGETAPLAICRAALLATLEDE
mgnify:CR=1 FL=1